MDSAPGNLKNAIPETAAQRCSDNMQQNYRRTPMAKSDFNRVAKQLYGNHTSALVFSCKFAASCRTPFRKNTSGWLLLFFRYLKIHTTQGMKPILSQ